MFQSLRKRLQPVAQRALRVVARAFSRWCKPQLVAENLLLRQQLIVLDRSGKRPR